MRGWVNNPLIVGAMGCLPVSTLSNDGICIHKTKLGSEFSVILHVDTHNIYVIHIYIARHFPGSLSISIYII